MSSEETQTRWRRMDELLDRAQHLPPNEREGFLQVECGDDVSLFQEVRSLLEHADPGQALFDHLGDSLIGAKRRKSETPQVPTGKAVGHYRIDGALGGGGMGVVCRARDERDGSLAAIKFLPPHLRADARATARFLEEGRVEAAIEHENVCDVLGLGNDEALGPYIVMALYVGQTLKERLQDGPIPPQPALSLGEQMALGLAAAHAHGVIHRDIKPSNVFVTSGDRVKILDFGAAKQSDISLTETGKILGTVTYMAPEQITGGKVAPATDVWALGMVLHEMLTGRHPFRERSMAATVRRLLSGNPDPLRIGARGGPPGLEALIDRALAKDVAKRPAASQMAAELKALQVA